jgi:hypothetical protein
MLKLLFMLILSACGTYVPVSYRKGSETSLSQGSRLKLIISPTTGLAESQKASLQERMGTEVAKDGWLVFSREAQDGDVELTIETYLTQDALISASESTREDDGKKTIRSATATAQGESRFIVYDVKRKSSREHTIFADGKASSEVTLPKETNTKAVLSVIGLIMGYDRVEEARNNQDQLLAGSAHVDLEEQLPRAILEVLVPEKLTVRLEIDDEEDDMETVEEFVSKNDIESAHTYLLARSQESPRADILYNLGVMQEARGFHKDGCTLYQRAYETKKKDLYLKQHAACQTRHHQQPR